ESTMTIQFACACGQQLAAREEYAGKRVKCTSCGEIRTVPGGEFPPTREPAAPRLIRFNCSCGQICQAQPEYAGRSTRCPRCSTVLTIPAAGITAEAPAPRRPPSIQAEEPRPRAAARRGFEEDEDEAFDVDRRRRRRRGKKSKQWIWIAGAVTLLLVGGLVAWLLLRGGIDSDFDLVPPDAQGFVTLPVPDLLDSPLGKKVADKFAKQMKPLEEFEAELGLSRKDIDRVTGVLVDYEKKIGWVIIQTKKSYDKDKLLAGAKKWANTEFKEMTSEG